jgi:hypothetical protein
VHYQTPYASYAAQYEFTDGKVMYEDTLSLLERRIPSEQYTQLKNFMNDFTDAVKLPLFLHKSRS